MFNFSSVVVGEEFPDGKYFASVYDTQKIRWHIVISKQYNFVKVLILEFGPARVSAGGTESIHTSEKIDISRYTKPVKLEKGKNFDFGRFKFYQTSLVWFYGTLGKFSKVVWSRYGSMMEEARFRFIPFKYYKSFQKELLKNPKLTSEEFAKSM